jgi:hypothetical protein
MKDMEHGEQLNNGDDRTEETFAFPDSVESSESLPFDGPTGLESGEFANYESPGEVYDALGAAIDELDGELEPRLLSLVNG